MNQEKDSAGGQVNIMIFVAMLLNGIGFSIIMPVLPYYAESFGASAFQVGMLMTVYALCQFIFAPIWGVYSDKVGRKPVLLFGLLGFALTFIWFGLATDLWMLFGARILGGAFSCATMPVAMAYVGDTTSPEKRGASMGMVGASMGVGMIFGPAIGGFLSQISLAFPFLASGALAFLNAIGVFFFVDESLPPEKRSTSVEVSRAPMLDGLRSTLALLFVVTFLASIAESTNHGIFALFVEAKLGLKAWQIGWAFTTAGIVSVVVQGFLLGRIIKRIGEERTALIGIFLAGLSFLLFLQVANLNQAVIVMAVFAGGVGLIRPSVSSAISKKTSLQQGTAMGTMQGFDSLGRVVGPATGGFLLDQQLNLGYLFAFTVSALGFLTMLTYYLKHRGSAEQTG